MKLLLKKALLTGKYRALPCLREAVCVCVFLFLLQQLKQYLVFSSAEFKSIHVFEDNLGVGVIGWF